MNKKTLLTAAFISVLLLQTAAGTLLINLGWANPNPFGYPDIISEEGSPDSKTEPPTVLIEAPTNGASNSSNSLSLTYNASIGNSSTASVRFLWKVTFEADWLPNNVTTYEFNADKDPYTTELLITEFSKTLNLTEIPEGTHSLMVHVTERGAYERISGGGFDTKVYITNFFIVGSSSVVSTVDLTSPTISVLSVENRTYYVSDVPLTVVADEVLSRLAYSLDGHENVTVTGNTTLTNLTVGEHNLMVYATDLAGNTIAAKTIFTITEPFATSLVIGSVITVVVVGVGSLVYFKKRKH